MDDQRARSESRTSSPQMMQTNVPGVFAAGDAVTFPLAWRNNRKVNIPHWQMAHAQGTANLWCKQIAPGTQCWVNGRPVTDRVSEGSEVTCQVCLILVRKPEHRAGFGARRQRPPSRACGCM